MTERENERETERDTARFIAWGKELRLAHVRLREGLQIARKAVRDGQPGVPASRDVLLYCHGFCAALERHHHGEGRALFPAIEAAHPQLASVLRALEQDHSLMARLLEELRASAEQTAAPEELDRHLDGVAAIMENHFRYEEKQLLVILEGLKLHAAVADVFGP